MWCNFFAKSYNKIINETFDCVVVTESKLRKGSKFRFMWPASGPRIDLGWTYLLLNRKTIIENEIMISEIKMY